MNENAIRRAITSLRMIFWGGLLWVFDISFSQTMTYNYGSYKDYSGFKFDILNDAVGAFLIAVAVFRLARISVHDRYAKVMMFVKIVAVLAVLNEIRDHYITQWPDAFLLTLTLFNLTTLIATVAFCYAMRWLCEETQLNEVIASWKLTELLYIIFGIAGFFLPLLLLIPFIHLFISTSRMRRAAYWLWRRRIRDMETASFIHFNH